MSKLVPQGIMVSVRWTLTIVAFALLLFGLGLGLLLLGHRMPSEPTTRPMAIAKVQGITTQATPELPRRVLKTYRDLIRAMPGLEESTPAESRLPVSRIARLRLELPCYVCPRGDLWIAHPDARPIRDILTELPDQPVHLTREQVVFVYWHRTGKRLEPWPVIRDETGHCTLLRTGKPEVKLDRTDYHWGNAANTASTVAIPCDQGVATLTADEGLTQQYREVGPKGTDRPQIAITTKGFIAWVPVTTPDAQAATVLRFADGKFVDGFSTGDWAGPFVHLIPYIDGSVLQVRPVVRGSVKLTITPLETNAVDEPKIRDLVTALADEDREARDEAHEQLAAMGPSTWTLLEKLQSNQPPEAQIRLKQILQARTEPTLGRFRLIEDKLQPVWRLQDGGVIFLAESGVAPAGDEGEPVIPAWICVRPGLPITLLPPMLTRSLALGSVDVQVLGRGDWVVSDETDGARLFFGQELAHLTKEKDYSYRKAAGLDQSGRVLLTTPDAQEYGHDFLLVDPFIPDPTPVLQMWTMTLPEGEVGWDGDNWPAVKRGQPWALDGSQWKPLKGELLVTPPVVASTIDGQLTLSQMGTLPDGSTVWKGGDVLELRKPDGKAMRQPRPAGMPPGDSGAAVSRDRLFVLHLSGKLSKLRIDPASSQPFSLETVFVDNIPLLDQVRRMWIDPAGRLCIVPEDSQLVIVFIENKVPNSILDLIPTDELKEARPESPATDRPEH